MKTTLYNLVSEAKEQELFNKLSVDFPEMIETSKSIEVIEWEDEFAIADKNPEIIDLYQFYSDLLKQNQITSEEFQNRMQSLSNEYASKTVGISFIDKMQVSFRNSEKPTFAVALHELGHCHYKETDIIWGAMYGGGESLMWLGLTGRSKVSEKEILLYHTLLHDAYKRPEQLAKEIAEKIVSQTKLKCQPHLYSIMLYAGTIPDGLTKYIEGKEEIFTDLCHDKWHEVKVDSKNIRSFLINLVEGIKYNDSFYLTFAKVIGITH